MSSCHHHCHHTATATALVNVLMDCSPFIICYHNIVTEPGKRYLSGLFSSANIKTTVTPPDIFLNAEKNTHCSVGILLSDIALIQYIVDSALIVIVYCSNSYV